MRPQAPSDVEAPTTEVGEVVGAYRVVEVLGHGAMGMVYRAHDPRLDRFVALKLVHPGHVARDPTKARARLVSEARALARVSHPNVLAVYDVGVHEGLVFVALELIDGVDLAQWLRDKERAWSEVVAVFIEAAAGLTAVHAAGLVHRDVKPANILVEHGTRARGFGRVLVADFGIARATASATPVRLPGEPPPSQSSEHDEDDARLTAAGRVVGTPAYMAPEQHLGHEVGPAADQYALCVALHEALYRRRPFRDDAKTIVRAKLAPPDEPPPLDVPAWLWRIVRRGLSPRPEDRFASLADLRHALQTGAPRRRWIVALGAAVAVLSTAAVILAMTGPTPPCSGMTTRLAEVWSDSRRASIATAFAASGQPHAQETWRRVAERFDGYAHELEAMVRDTCEPTQAQSEAMFDRRMLCLDRRMQELDRSLALLAVGDADLVQHADDVASALGTIAACGDIAALEAGIEPPSPAQREAVAEVRRVLADAEVLQAAGRYDDAASRAEAAVDLARAVDHPAVVVEALAHAGELRERQSRIDEARALLEEAISLGIEIGHDEPVVRAAIMRTWIAAEYERDAAAAETWSGLGRSRLERIGDPPLSAMALHNALGTAYMVGGRNDDALHEFERALARVEDDPEQVAWAGTLHANIGNARYRLGNLEDAGSSYERALELFRARFGDDHPHVANVAVRRAQILELRGRHVEAIASLREAIASLERMQATPAELATALIALGQALRSAGADQESNTTYRRAVELLEPTGDDVSLAHALVSYGHSCVDQHVYDAAEAQFQRAVALLEPVDPGDPNLGNAFLGLGRIRASQGKPDDALSFYRRALEAAAPGSRNAARALVSIARVHHEAGRDDQAAAALDQQDRILASAALVLPDDRLTAAIARVDLLVDRGRAQDATMQLEALERLLARTRDGGGALRVAEGELALGRARLARGEHEAGCTATRSALQSLDEELEPKLAERARATMGACDRAAPR